MSYYSKEIPEWSNGDLISYFNANNLRSIASKMQNNLLTGYDLFYLNLKDLKHDLGISDYHDRLLTYREIRKLTLQHLKLTVIYEGESCIISLDNDMKLQLSQLFNYIGAYFNIETNDILIKDARSVDIISPSSQICELMIISPEKYKTLNISKMKDKSAMKPVYQQIPYNDQLSFQKKKSSFSNEIVQENTSLDQFNSAKNDDIRNNNYSSNYFSNNNLSRPISSNREHNSFAKTPKSNQPQKSSSITHPPSSNSNNPISLVNPNKASTPFYVNNTPNRESTSLQSNEANTHIKSKKYTSTFTNNDILNEPETSSNANNYYLNQNTAEATKLPLNSNNSNPKAQRPRKDNERNSLNLKENPIEIRYKSEKRIYRQHEQNTDSNTITANLLKSNNYLGTDNSIENDEFLFYNNVNRKNNSSSSPNIVNYAEYSNTLNYGNNQSNQNQSSNVKSFKQKRTFNEDFLDDNDNCSNNDFS